MKIAIVTGSRADRGALEMIDEALTKIGHIVARMDVGRDVLGLATTGWPIDRMQCAAITEQAIWIVRTFLARNFVDMVVLHGDRYEILGAAVAANVMGVPIAHLSGGDITEGSQDECYRHAITKLAHLHFATHQAAANRIMQMGEHPSVVYVTGDPGIDRVMKTELLDRLHTIVKLGLQPSSKDDRRFVLVAYHPNTVDYPNGTELEIDRLVSALRSLDDEMAIVLVGPNSDAGADIVHNAFDELSKRRSHVVYHMHMLRQLYLSAMAHCDVMVGNSSAGLCEAPSFRTPVVNIGDRQKGRPCASNVITVPADAEHILLAIKMMTVGRLDNVKNPFGNGNAADLIARVIGTYAANPRSLLQKRFYSGEGHFRRAHDDV